MSQKRLIILFDGKCNLCSSFVRWLIRRDHRKRFRFAPLQSEAAKNVMSDRTLRKNKDEPLQSVVLIEDQRFYFKSDAVLRAAGKLGGGWRIFTVFKIFPRGFRDSAYDFVARNRYRWFGQKKEMMRPAENEREHFL
ncbi:MAG: thiol-disulfide oxidoreductase DCC family protein [Bacteroidales bacterium]